MKSLLAENGPGDNVVKPVVVSSWKRDIVGDSSILAESFEELGDSSIEGRGL